MDWGAPLPVIAGAAAAIVAVLRVAIFVQAIAVMVLFRHAYVALFRHGGERLTDMARALQFLFASSALVGQIFFLFFPAPIVLILELLLMNAALLVSLLLAVRSSRRGLREYDGVMNRPDLAMPLVELAAFDEIMAREYADKIRRETARWLARG